MRNRSIPLALAFCLPCLARVATQAATPDSLPSHAIVPGFERFYADDKADLSRAGKLLLSELNCQACHTLETKLPVGPKKGPVLTNVAGRVRPDYLRRFITDPQHTKPGTTMPGMFAGLDAKAQD